MSVLRTVLAALTLGLIAPAAAHGDVARPVRVMGEDATCSSAAEVLPRMR